MNPIASLPYFIPELILLGAGFLILLVDLFFSERDLLYWIGLAGLAGALAFTGHPAEPLPIFFGYFLLDPFSYFFKIAALGIVFVTLLASWAYAPRTPEGRSGTLAYPGEYLALFLFITLGLILMASANNLLMIFLSIEFVSILSYLLVGFQKKNPRSKESALKYFLFGSVASGVMLYGMSILFGLTGAIDLNVIQARLAEGPVSKELTLVALLLLMVGLGFKISMAPFHMWAPDVYEGAPTPVTGFLTVGPKALGFAILFRVLHTTFFEWYGQWSYLLVGLSMLTMTLGNVIAISQTNIKRLLGYSSIAQAGYILMGLAISNEVGVQGVLIYLVSYVLTNLGAFLVIIAASNQLGSDEIDSYAGLAKRSPFLAFSLTLFLLSLAGIPPLAGFIGKFYVFASAIEGRFFALAIVAALNSAVAAYYYFKIVKNLYLVPATTEEAFSCPAPIWVGLILTLAGILLLGLFPSPLITFVRHALIL